MDVIRYTTTPLGTIPDAGVLCGTIGVDAVTLGRVMLDESEAGTVELKVEPLGSVTFRNSPIGIIPVPFFPKDEDLSGYVDSLGAYLTDSQGNVITW